MCFPPQAAGVYLAELENEARIKAAKCAARTGRGRSAVVVVKLVAAYTRFTMQKRLK